MQLISTLFGALPQAGSTAHDVAHEVTTVADRAAFSLAAGSPWATIGYLLLGIVGIVAFLSVLGMTRFNLMHGITSSALSGFFP